MQIADSKGRLVEPGRKYVIQWGSRCKPVTCCRIEGRIQLIDSKAKAVNVFDAQAGQIHRFHEWVEAQGRANLVKAIEDIGERAQFARSVLDQLERELHEILFAGDVPGSLDEIMGYVRDGRGTAEELVAKVPCALPA